MKLENLHDLFIFKLTALYDIEGELLKALPKMSAKAEDEDLKKAFDKHKEETQEHVDRLAQIFDMFGVKPKKTKIEGIRGIIADAESTAKEKPSQEALDAVLIASARYAEHYEMAGYMTALSWAETLGYDDAASLLKTTLEEEVSADEKLASIAESSVDEKAMENDMEVDEGEDIDEEDED